MPARITLDPDLKPWDRQPGEAAQHYADFQYYLRQEPYGRSIRAAARTKYGADGATKHRIDYFLRKSMWFRWVERSHQYDLYLAELDRIEWEKRRREVKEIQYQHGMAYNRLMTKALIDAEGFITETKTIIPGKDGKPDREVITKKFNLNELTKAYEVTSKILTLVTGGATSNINVNAKSIDALIQREIVKLANGGEEPEEEGEVVTDELGEEEYDFSDEIDVDFDAELEEQDA